MPLHVRILPRDRAGRPVPWFAERLPGQPDPDFRVTSMAKIARALRARLCWVCGIGFRFEDDRTFVIGPMCAVNQISAEPPAHWDCAVYAATHCPFLTHPGMRRRESGLDGTVQPEGMIPRNPGVCLTWAAGASRAWMASHRSWSWFQTANGTVLFDVGDPKRVAWWCEGRPATRAEVTASIESGMPTLLQEASATGGDDAVTGMQRRLETAMALIPAA